MRKILLIVLLITAITKSIYAQTQTIFYVDASRIPYPDSLVGTIAGTENDPFMRLEHARLLLRYIRSDSGHPAHDSDLTVRIKKGTYFLQEPFELGGAK